MALLSQMAEGIDPTAERRRESNRQVTLEQAFAAFFASRTKLASGTVSSYGRTADLYLRDWRKRSITDITRQMVLKRHQDIAKAHGEITANNAMRHLRSLYNFTAATKEDFPPNPVSILTQARSWYPEQRRRNVVAAHDLPMWWAAVMEEPEYSRDFPLLALFTGMRRNEIARLRWNHIDFKGRALHIPKTKNGDPLDMPVSETVLTLLKKRKHLVMQSPWVFPSKGRTGHIVETKKFTLRVEERSGVAFTLHDLRRTFIPVFGLKPSAMSASKAPLGSP